MNSYRIRIELYAVGDDIQEGFQEAIQSIINPDSKAEELWVDVFEGGNKVASVNISPLLEDKTKPMGELEWL